MTADRTKYQVKFAAEVKEVKSRKTVSLDKEYRVVLITSDPSVMLLDTFATDVLLDITAEPQDA